MKSLLRHLKASLDNYLSLEERREKQQVKATSILIEEAKEAKTNLQLAHEKLKQNKTEIQNLEAENASLKKKIETLKAKLAERNGD